MLRCWYLQARVGSAIINLGVYHNWRPCLQSTFSVYSLETWSSGLWAVWKVLALICCHPQLFIKTDTMRRMMRCNRRVDSDCSKDCCLSFPGNLRVFSESSFIRSLATSLDHTSWGWGLWMWCMNLEGRLGCQPAGITSRTSFLSIPGMALWLRQHVKPDLVAEQHSVAFLCQPLPEFRATAGRLGGMQSTSILRKLLPFYFRFCLYHLRAAASKYCPPSLYSRKMWDKNCGCLVTWGRA